MKPVILSIIVNIFVLIILSVSVSCEQNKDNNIVNDYQSVFNSEYQTICYKESLKSDIKGDICFPLKSDPNGDKLHPELSVSFSFYNYGNDIRLFNGCDNDFFIYDFADINYLSRLKDDKISFVSNNKSEKYGEWSMVNVIIDNNYIHDVFMTPLAVASYKKDGIEDLVFIQFVYKDWYMNVLFCGQPRVLLAILSCPNKVIKKCNHVYSFDSLKSGPGRFWHKITNN